MSVMNFCVNLGSWVKLGMESRNMFGHTGFLLWSFGPRELVATHLLPARYPSHVGEVWCFINKRTGMGAIASCTMPGLIKKLQS